MSSFRVKDIIERLERMEREMHELQQGLHDYHGKMKQTVEELKRDGLPTEFTDTFETEHVERLSHYFNGLATYLEEESIPYTRQVSLKTQELAQSM